MAAVRQVTALLCPKCLAPDNWFSVSMPSASIVVDEFCCTAGMHEPSRIDGKAVVLCGNCRHKGKASRFAVKHTRQPGESFKPDELQFLNEPCKGLAAQPSGMTQAERKTK